MTASPHARLQPVSLPNPYASFLDQLEKPARYIGGEKFAVRKDWSQLDCRIALCFPDTYEIGMGHLGFKILYDELNKKDDLFADRVFAPWMDMEKEIRERSLKLVGLDSFRPLNEFHILGFSLQYEMTYTNILNMLDLGGVTLFQKEREEHEPFVICGGPCATHPEPLAPFMDFVVVGDGEDLFVRLSRFIAKGRKEGRSRDEILKELAEWPGIYVPSLYSTEIDEKTELEVVSEVTDPTLREKVPSRVRRHFVENLKDYPIPTESPVAHMTAIFDRFSVELARGCTEGCRFCQAGMIYRPVRERRPEDVMKSVTEGLEKGGFREASLTCLSTADYSAITPLLLNLLDEMKEREATLGVSSLRAYGLDNRIFDKMAEVKNSSLTFAPEAATDRMRQVINKNITEEDMLKTAKEVFSRGWQKMKLYFMIGLPTETDEDVSAIMETGRKAKNIGIQEGVRRPQLTISASSFVPKPHTPFQWHGMITLSEIERKQELLFIMAKRYGLNFRKHLSKTSFFEGVIARGDRRVGELIYLAWKKGARFDGWEECFSFETWMEAVGEIEMDVSLYLGTLRMDGRLPWDHIDVGLEDKFLEREWKKAMKDRLSPPCGKPAGAIVHHSSLQALEETHDVKKKRLVCYHCGVACDLTAMVDERRDYLTSLKAIKSKPYVRPERSTKSLAQRREKRGQEVGHTYRIEFAKLGPLSFISHLDLQKVIARVFKRAKIKVLLSEGFNQRPLFSFGGALSLGISSLGESFDVRVPRSWENLDDVLAELNKCSERGLIFKKAQEIERKTPSLQSLVKAYRYYLIFPHDVGKEKLNEVLHQMMERSDLVIESYSAKEKRNVEKDVRPFLMEMSLQEIYLSNEERELLSEVLDLDGIGVEVLTRVENGGSIRPSDFERIFAHFGLRPGRAVKIGALLHHDSMFLKKEDQRLNSDFLPPSPRPQTEGVVV